MRPFVVGDRLCIADVTAEVEQAVRELGFVRRGAVFVRTLPGVTPEIAERFERFAETIVRQAARLEPVPWEEALAALVQRTDSERWTLVGSAALAVRGVAVEPRDIDLTASAADCELLGDALRDRLVEPLSDGGYLGERWFRAFAGARIECVGGIHPHAASDVLLADDGPETVEWKGHVLRVPPLALQLTVAERRGLHERAARIRETLAP